MNIRIVHDLTPYKGPTGRAKICSLPKFAMGLAGMPGIYSNMKLVGAGVPLLDAASRRVLND